MSSAVVPRGSNVTAQMTPPIQDIVLKHLRDNKLDVTMFLVNGIRLQGRISRFDNHTVQLVWAPVRRLSTSMRFQRSTQQSRSN